jgi:hypothetical protein
MSLKNSSVLAVAFVGLLAGSAHAQDVITARVPFSFVVDHKEFPAGRYDFQMRNSAGAVLFIEGESNRSSAFELTMPVGGTDPAGREPSLVFTRHGNAYRLTQVWESTTEGQELLAPSEDARSQHADSQSGDGVHYVLAANWK